LPDLIGGMAVPEPEYMTEDYDPYEFVKREIPADGDEFGIVLTQGEYVVGSHIPEGIYTACTMGEYASIMVEDYENEIWLSEWMDEENSQVEDVRLYKGAVLEVLGVSEVVLETDNAQMYTWTYSKNPLDGISAIIQVDEPAIAGEHFRAGVYDIEAKEGYGQLIITIYDEDGSELQWKYLWLDAGSTMEGSYKNLVLPENATLVVDSEINEGLKVSITASERIDQKISDGNYLDYYE